MRLANISGLPRLGMTPGGRLNTNSSCVGSSLNQQSSCSSLFGASSSCCPTPPCISTDATRLSTVPQLNSLRTSTSFNVQNGCQTGGQFLDKPYGLSPPLTQSGVTCALTPQQQRSFRSSAKLEWLGGANGNPNLNNTPNQARLYTRESLAPTQKLQRSGSSTCLKEFEGGSRSLSNGASTRCRQLLQRRSKITESEPESCKSCSSCGTTRIETRPSVCSSTAGSQHTIRNSYQTCSEMSSRSAALRSQSLRESSTTLNASLQYPLYTRLQHPSKTPKTSQNTTEQRRQHLYGGRNSEPPTIPLPTQTGQRKPNSIRPGSSTPKFPTCSTPQKFPITSHTTPDCPGSASSQATCYNSQTERSNCLLSPCSQSYKPSCYTTSTVCSIAATVPFTVNTVTDKFQTPFTVDPCSVTTTQKYSSPCNKSTFRSMDNYSMAFPGRQTSMDEISHIAHPAGRQRERPMVVPTKTLMSALPNSHSAGSNLSGTEEKPFYDSGISSSSYSKDSACTSPAENSVGISVLPQVSGTEELSLSWQLSVTQANGIQQRTDHFSYSGCNPNQEGGFVKEPVTRAKSTEPVTPLCDHAKSFGGKSKLTKPSLSASIQHRSEAVLSNGMNPVTNISRQKASELYSLVKSRDDPKKFSTQNLEHQVYSGPNSNSSSPNHLFTHLRPQSLAKQTAAVQRTRDALDLSKAKTSSTLSINTVSGSIQPQLTLGEQKLTNSKVNHEDKMHGALDKGLKGKDNSVTTTSGHFENGFEDSGGEGKQAASQPISDSLLQVGRVAMQSVTKDRHGTVGLNTTGVDESKRRFSNEVNSIHSETTTSIETTPTGHHIEKHSNKNHSCGSTNSRKAVSCSNSSAMNPIDLVCNSNDPEQLLSSLSKLTLDDTNKSNLWDDNYYFSDVESDYAALELVLPFDISPKASNDASGSSGSKMQSVVEKTHELGYFSDTEAVLQAPVAPSPTTTDKSNSAKGQLTTNSAAHLTVSETLPVTSWVPEETTPKRRQGSTKSVTPLVKIPEIKNHAAHEAAETSEKCVESDETKWPVLKSAKSFSHSMFQKNLAMGEINLTASESKLYRPLNLDHLKLPYPMVPVMGSRGLSAHSPTRPIRSNGSKNVLSFRPITSESQLSETEPTDKPLFTTEIPQTTESNECSELVERLRSELRYMAQQLSALTIQLGRKDREIDRLRNVVSKLQCDIQLHQMSHQLVHPDADGKLSQQFSLSQEIQETLSLHSLTSGASLGSQESFNWIRTNEGGSGPCIKPDVVTEPDCGVSKRTRWTRPSLGKTFKKRAKSSMETGDHGTKSRETQRVTNVSGSTTVLRNPKIPQEEAQQSNHTYSNVDGALGGVARRPKAADPMQTLLKKMSWEMSCLEADNQRLRLLLFNSPILTEQQQEMKGYHGTDVTISDLSNRYCGNAANFVQVFVATEYEDAYGAVELSSVQQDKKSKQMKDLVIGRIGVRENLTWSEFDCNLLALFQDYIRFLDPDDGLGLNSHTVCAYELITCKCEGDCVKQSDVLVRTRQQSLPTEFTFPDSKHKDVDSAPIVWLRRMLTSEPNSSSLVRLLLAEMHGVANNRWEHPNKIGLLSFKTLIPALQLKMYFQALSSNHFAVICGPAGTGKKRITRELATLLVKNHENTQAVKIISVKSDGNSDAKEAIEIVRTTLDSDQNTEIIVLENLHYITGSIKKLMTIIETCSKCSPIFIATSDIRSEEIQALHNTGTLCLFEHLADIETTTNYLSCHLRRRFAQSYLCGAPCNATTADHEILTKLITWLPKAWRYLNGLFSLGQEHQCRTIFGLRVFLTCPMDVSASRKWFTDLWNNLLIPFLFRAVSSDENACITNATKVSASYDWMIATWPWPRDPTENGRVQCMTHPLSIVTGACTTPEAEIQTTQPLRTFGQPKESYEKSRQKVYENRSSLDSGIVPDGFPLANNSTTVYSSLETRSSIGAASFDG